MCRYFLVLVTFLPLYAIFSEVRIKTTIDQAGVYINGERRGSTSKHYTSFPLSPGSYKIEMRQDISRYEFYGGSAQITLGQFEIREIEIPVRKSFTQEAKALMQKRQKRLKQLESQAIVASKDFMWISSPIRFNGEVDWSKAKSICTALLADNRNDWSVPILHQMKQIIDQAKDYKSYTKGFVLYLPKAKYTRYWVNATDRFHKNDAYVIDPNTKKPIATSKNQKHFFVCVAPLQEEALKVDLAS